MENTTIGGKLDILIDKITHITERDKYAFLTDLVALKYMTNEQEKQLRLLEIENKSLKADNEALKQALNRAGIKDDKREVR